MPVNANTHLSPALWQGVMLVVMVIWALYVYGGKRRRTAKEINISTSIVAAIGVVSFFLILCFL